MLPTKIIFVIAVGLALKFGVAAYIFMFFAVLSPGALLLPFAQSWPLRLDPRLLLVGPIVLVFLAAGVNQILKFSLIVGAVAAVGGLILEYVIAKRIHRRAGGPNHRMHATRSEARA
jgi:hypothetical protein